MENQNNIPEYEQDKSFDKNIDYSGVRYFIIFLSTFIGAASAALCTAIYYSIINLL